MPTNWDALNVRLSRELNDTVAVATTNGDSYTSAQRDQWLNNGTKNWLNKKLANGDFEALQSYIQEKSASLASTIVSPTNASFITGTAGGGVLVVLSMKNLNYTPAVPVSRLPESGLASIIGLSGIAGYEVGTANQFWTWDNGSIKVLGAGSTDVVTVRYVMRHADFTAGTGSTDIPVAPQYWQEVLDEALKIAYSEDPSNANLAKLQVKANG